VYRATLENETQEAFYFMNPRVFLASGGLFALLLALPAHSLAGEERLAAPADPLALYFDESELVEVATRAPVPLVRVAENVSIVTAGEIEAMHVQRLPEVLSRLPGIHVSLLSPDFNGASAVYVQGSREQDVLVLIDGVRLYSTMSGDADISHIPLRIIKRIEVIKGPSSSVWGSSQGGVINIITRDTGTSAKPSGSVAGEYGERGVADYEADLAGKAERLGYYLYAGQQESDGLRNDRYYDSSQAYGKLSYGLPNREGKLTFTGLAVDPHFRTGDFPTDGFFPAFSQDSRDRSYFMTANYDTLIGEACHLNIGTRQYERTFIQDQTVLAANPASYTPGSIFYLSNWHEKSQGTNFLLTGSDSLQQLSLGGEINRSRMETVTDFGPWAQQFKPAQYESKPGAEETWGLFVNDTLRFNRFTLIPGIRYDHRNISESMVSPSLGVTFQLRPDTLLRATVSRGFEYPALSFLVGGGVYSNPNPDLKAERVTSYQLGVESHAISGISLKLTAFDHRITDFWQWWQATPDFTQGHYQNGGTSERLGMEAEVETNPWHSLTLVANSTYIVQDSVASVPELSDSDTVNDSSTAANLILRYNDQKDWHGELACQYVWWFSSDTPAQSRDPIWSLNLGRTVYRAAGFSADLYAKVNNLFNGNSEINPLYPIPNRWWLAGMRVNF
jgi:vitamin B12 transporter